MAEIIVPEGYINAHFMFQQAGAQGLSTFALGFEAEAFAGTLDDLAEDITNAFWTGYGAANVLNSYTFLGVKLYLGPGDPFLVGEYTDPEVGTASGSPLPNNCSWVVKKRTAVAGVRYRGRMYWPALQTAENFVDGVGNIDPTARFNSETRILLALAAVQAVTGVGAFVLFHAVPQEGEAPAPTVITSFSLDSKIGTQRRRMR